jgi:tetratricopeptide (TPR) repeat protein
VDNDLLRGLDWELEGDEDTDTRVLLKEAVRQNRAGEVEEALGTLERALLQAEVEPVGDESVLALLLLTRVVCLAKLERFDEAGVVTGRLLEVTEGGEGTLRRLDGLAKSVHAVLLGERGHREEAIERLTELEREFGDDPDPTFRAVGISALRYRIRQLVELRRVDEATTQWNALLADCGSNPEATIRAGVAWAGTDVAIALLRQKKDSAGLAIVDQVIGRFRSAVESETRAAVAVAMACRLRVYLRRGRLLGYWRSAQEFFAFVGRDPEPEVLEAIREAYPSRQGNRLLRAARTFNG